MVFRPNYSTFAPDMTNMEKTNAQFEQAIAECRALFEKKLHDYKASWRILRPTALTDQLFIKAKRIRSLEIKKESKVGEGIRPEFIALINYGIVGLIQLSKGFADTVDISNEEAMKLYDQFAKEALELMKKKNHDYDEAWRSMRVSSYTDLILTKIERIKEIEDLGGETLVSEGVDALRDECLAPEVLDLLDALDFGEDEVGVRTHPHRAPRLVVVVVLLLHQFQRFVGILVIEHHRLLVVHVDGVGEPLVELDESHDAVVDQGDELGPDAFAYQRLFLDFQRADALRLDEELVGQGCRTQDAPRGFVVV